MTTSGRSSEAFIDDLAEAEATLALVQDDAVKLPIRFGLSAWTSTATARRPRTRRSGSSTPASTARSGGARPAAKDAEDFPITFDRGDVAWLRGYCHLLMAFVEVYLAHDGERLFDHTAHLFFAKPKTPFAFLKNDPQGIDRRDPTGPVGRSATSSRSSTCSASRSRSPSGWGRPWSTWRR